MTKLIWNQEGSNRYEFGVDRGVYYHPVGPDVYDYGVVWNGLVSVDETSVGGENVSYHFDGIKYMDKVEPRNYHATITAYSSPDAFSASLGNFPLIPGFILTRQARTLFGLSYRTLFGDDVGYKIHLVYNILASPGKKGSSTTDASGSAELLSWKMDAVPPVGKQYRPTAHFILDSVKMDAAALDAIELILYGTDKTTARLPNIGELRDMVALWNPLIIVPQSVTGLAGLISGVGDLYTTSIEGLHRAPPQTRLAPSPVKGLYRLES